MIESGEALQNDKCGRATTPENRMPICADGRGMPPLRMIASS
jgi:hypothetical protein